MRQGPQGHHNHSSGMQPPSFASPPYQIARQYDLDSSLPVPGRALNRQWVPVKAITHIYEPDSFVGCGETRHMSCELWPPWPSGFGTELSNGSSGGQEPRGGINPIRTVENRMAAVAGLITDSLPSFIMRSVANAWSVPEFPGFRIG